MPAKKKPSTMAAKALPKKLRAENAKQLKGGVGTSAGRYIRFD